MVSWSSKRQAFVALSSSEAEYIAAATGSCEAIWLKKLLLELGRMKKSPTLIYCDNQLCVKLANNPVFLDRPKHIEAMYHFIRGYSINKKEIYMEYCSTKYNVADIHMKALPMPKYEDCNNGLDLCVPTTILKREC